jgi:hypothetical protein
VAYPNDHLPPHVHGFYAETEVIVDLYDGNKVALARRKNAIRPPNAKKSNVKKILVSAANNVEALVALWEMNHGKS